MVGGDAAYSVFISYARETAGEAKRLKERLKAASPDCDVYVCHIDEQQHGEGRAEGRGAFLGWPLDVQKAHLRSQLHARPVLVILWDRNYARSAWCRWELTEASALRGQERRVVVLRRDSTPLPRWLATQDSSSGLATTHAEVCDRVLARRPAGAQATESIGLLNVRDPGFSLLESPFWPSLDGAGAMTRARSVGLRLGPMLVSIAFQLAMWWCVQHALHGEHARHLGALLAALTIAGTVVGALLLSSWAAAGAGVVTAVAALAATPFLDPSPQTTAGTAAATAMFMGAVLLAGRHALLTQGSAPRARWLEHPRGHALACLGLLAAITLLHVAIERAAAAASSAALEVARSKDPVVAIAVALHPDLETGGSALSRGLLVGVMLGTALGLALARRVRNVWRDSDWRGDAVAALALVGGFAAGVEIGGGVGLWIDTHPASTVGGVAGAYAGTQIGLILAAATAIPIALGTSRLDPDEERWWGIAALVTASGVVLHSLHRLPFGGREGIPDALVIGSVVGLAMAVTGTVGARAGLYVWRQRARWRFDRARAAGVLFSAGVHGLLMSIALAIAADAPPAPVAAGDRTAILINLAGGEQLPGPSTSAPPPPPPAPPPPPPPRDDTKVRVPHDATVEDGGPNGGSDDAATAAPSDAGDQIPGDGRAGGDGDGGEGGDAGGGEGGEGEGGEGEGGDGDGGAGPGVPGEGGGRNLIVNGGFEEPALTQGWQLFPEIPGWQRTKGTDIEVQRGAAGKSHSGEQHVELDGNNSTSIAQEVVVVPGRNYRLRFFFAARPGQGADQNVLVVRWNEQEVFRKATDDPSWVACSVVVTSSAARATVALADEGSSDSFGTYIDDIELIAE
jgi:hypothetical protein